MYPNPKDKKYKYSPWEQIEKDYVYARGATELLANFLSDMTQQKDIAKNLKEQLERDDTDYGI